MARRGAPARGPSGETTSAAIRCVRAERGSICGDHRADAPDVASRPPASQDLVDVERRERRGRPAGEGPVEAADLRVQRLEPLAGDALVVVARDGGEDRLGLVADGDGVGDRRQVLEPSFSLIHHASGSGPPLSGSGLPVPASRSNAPLLLRLDEALGVGLVGLSGLAGALRHPRSIIGARAPCNDSRGGIRRRGTCSPSSPLRSSRRARRPPSAGSRPPSPSCRARPSAGGRARRARTGGARAPSRSCLRG